MSEEAAKKRLGRGLAALIGEMDNPVATEPVAEDDYVSIGKIVANPNNPRRDFGESDLSELAQSIERHGVVQPVVVRPSPTSTGFEIIAGERRWRAAQRAGLTKVPVIIREVDDRAALELAIVENIQRADLNPVEEANGYQQLIDEHGYTQAELAKVIGKSRSHVANTLRLLVLPELVLAMLADGSLTAGHARALITVDNPESLARRIVGQGYSVRQAEALAKATVPTDGKQRRHRGSENEKDADTKALEKALCDATGYKVSISYNGAGGDVKIAYKTLEQLDAICRRLGA